MLRVEAMAEGVADHFIGQHTTVPGLGEAAKTVHSAGGVEDSVHVSIMTIAGGGGKIRGREVSSKRKRPHVIHVRPLLMLRRFAGVSVAGARSRNSRAHARDLYPKGKGRSR